jgi:hypothetical protein
VVIRVVLPFSQRNGKSPQIFSAKAAAFSP